MNTQKRLDDSMPGIFEKVAEYIVKNWKPQIGDKVSWKPHPEVKSEIVAIKSYRIGLKRERYYKLKNGQFLSKDEIIKID